MVTRQDQLRWTADRISTGWPAHEMSLLPTAATQTGSQGDALAEMNHQLSEQLNRQLGLTGNLGSDPPAMSQDELIESLVEQARKLHPIQLGLVIGVAEILQQKVVIARFEGSSFANPDFMIAFGNRLLLHHAFTYARLSKKHFEHALESAVNESGGKAKVGKNATNPGEDMILNGERCSLKTEAAASIRENEITISKFSEARWIQQCADLEALAAEVAARLPNQIGRVDRIFMLRFFQRPDEIVEYQLIEIPVALLIGVSSLKTADFSPRTAQGGSTARVKRGDSILFSLRLDGSDGKLTISNLKVSECIVHGTWKFLARQTPP